MEHVVEAINWVKIAAYASAGFCVGVGVLGPSLGQGMIGAKACESIAQKPENAKDIQSAMFAGLIFVESSSIYCVVMGLILFFLS